MMLLKNQEWPKTHCCCRCCCYEHQAALRIQKSYSWLDGVYSRVISWLFSPNNSSTAITIIWLNKKTVAFMSEEKRQFFVIPPVGNKSAKLWTQNKTEIKQRHFYDSNVSLHLFKEREQSNSFTLSNFQRKKAKKHKTCRKKWILDPQTSKKEASSVKLITILVAAKSSKYF